MRYHLGCGSNYISGYLNVDFPEEEHTINLTVKADIYQDLRTLDYQPSEEIYSRHVFEHFNYVDSMFLLRQWTQSLKKGGKLIISMPDTEELCKRLLTASAENSFVVIRYMYGSHEAKWAYHINGWTPKMLQYVLELFGHGNFFIKRYVSGKDTNRYPNSSMTIESEMVNKLEKEIIDEKVRNTIFPLYLNGSAGDEKRLHELFISQYNLLTSKVG